MEFRLLSEEEILNILKGDIHIDFRPSEIKSADLIKRRIAEGRYFARGLFENNTLLAYAYFVTTRKYMLLDYFAVNAAVRGKGFGSLVLEKMEIMSESRSRKLFLEVEDPDFAENELDRITRIRRIAFYSRNNIEYLGVKTHVLTDDYLLLGSSALPPEKVASAIDEIYRAVFLPEFVRSNISIKY